MSKEKQAIVVADLGFGDAGKGTIVDFLTRSSAARTIVRYNGGPQAAHNVVCADGRHHTFSQFASGMFWPGTRTLLSRFMLINPLNMLKEARHLEAVGVPGALQRVQIDRRTLVITPFQRALNRLREIARADQRHGSCGEGIGECMADALADESAALRAGDLADRAALFQKLRRAREAKESDYAELAPFLPRTEVVRQECQVFTDPTYLEACADVYHFFAQTVEMIDENGLRELFEQAGTLIFEGAQGILLDENYGFAPYTTWSTTTFANAEELARENDYTGKVIRLGVTRSYTTRHGAGPFPGEEPALTSVLPEPHNTWNDWQREFRVGYYDLVATRYALEVAGKLDYLAITHADRLAHLPAWRVCTGYDYQGAETDLPDYFQHSGKQINALRVRRPPDLAYQEQLTRRLQACRPVYQAFASSPTADHHAYLSFIAEQLSTPLAIISSGPTADDKTLIKCRER